MERQAVLDFGVANKNSDITNVDSNITNSNWALNSINIGLLILMIRYHYTYIYIYREIIYWLFVEYQPSSNNDTNNDNH